MIVIGIPIIVIAINIAAIGTTINVSKPNNKLFQNSFLTLFANRFDIFGIINTRTIPINNNIKPPNIFQITLLV